MGMLPARACRAGALTYPLARNNSIYRCVIDQAVHRYALSMSGLTDVGRLSPRAHGGISMLTASVAQGDLQGSRRRSGWVGGRAAAVGPLPTRCARPRLLAQQGRRKSYRPGSKKNNRGPSQTARSLQCLSTSTTRRSPSAARAKPVQTPRRRDPQALPTCRHPLTQKAPTALRFFPRPASAARLAPHCTPPSQRRPLPPAFWAVREQPSVRARNTPRWSPIVALYSSPRATHPSTASPRARPGSSAGPETGRRRGRCGETAREEKATFASRPPSSPRSCDRHPVELSGMLASFAATARELPSQKVTCFAALRCARAR